MKILVVDDREENRALLQVKLRAHGYDSITASNGAEALVLLRQAPAHAVISDLLMPVMDGFQLTHAIKCSDTLREIPVVIYTSTYTDPNDEALARNLGANAFIIKPATDEKFFAVLAETIARATRGELPSHRLSQDELQHLRDYTARLIHKLEDKVEEVSRLNATLEERVRAATAGWREANMELEGYVNSVAHDLRAPLRAIQGFCSILLEEDGTLSAAERQNLLRRVLAGAANLQGMMQDLLDYSRLKHQEIPLAPVELNRVVEQAREHVAQEIKAAGARLEVAPALPRVLAYEPVLCRAVANLLSNAVKFVRPGVRPEVCVLAELRERQARLLIADNGIGIDADERQRIFQLFERVHDGRIYPGTGVGLAMTKRAMEKMGGRVGFDSEPTKGSRFWIELPTAD